MTRDTLIEKVKIKLAKGDAVTYKSHSTQINLYDCCSEKDYNFYNIQQLIPEQHLYREYPQIINSFGFKQDDPKEEYARERNAHITVLYGLKDEDDYFKIRNQLKNQAPITFTIGDIDSFRGKDTPYDVIILKIESPELHKLHDQLKNTYKNDYKFPEYNPHMTLAYVKKGACKDIEGPCNWTNTGYKANKMIWSHIDKYNLELPFAGK